MSNRRSLVLMCAAILLLSAAAFAVEPVYNSDRISVQGRVTSIIQQGDQYQVTLNHGGYLYYVPISMVGSRGLRVGDSVRLGGLANGGSVNADMIAYRGDPTFMRDPAYRGVPFGQSGWMTATVLSTNRHYHYVTVVDDATGLTYKVDVRNLDSRYPFNMRDLHAGDHVSVLGSWENRDTFDARRIVY